MPALDSRFRLEPPSPSHPSAGKTLGICRVWEKKYSEVRRIRHCACMKCLAHSRPSDMVTSGISHQRECKVRCIGTSEVIDKVTSDVEMGGSWQGRADNLQPPPPTAIYSQRAGYWHPWFYRLGTRVGVPWNDTDLRCCLHHKSNVHVHLGLFLGFLPCFFDPTISSGMSTALHCWFSHVGIHGW